jgi:molybdopterin molybdotransferase
MRDVRMQGFAERADVEQVDAFLRAHSAPLPGEEVPLRACAGRVLAQDVRAVVDVPGLPRASMDGYAVRGEDTFGASAYEPVELQLLGETLPGSSFAGRVEKEQVMRE